MMRHAAVAAPNAQATHAAQVALADGGTALDAAIAAMVTATVTEPGIVSPLGGCYLNFWPHDGEPVVVDGNVEMPGRGASAERFGQGLISCTTTYGGGLTTYAGPGSVATPGMFAAMGLAHERFGRAPWASLLSTAEAAARDGFPLSWTAASYFALVSDSIFSWDPVTRGRYTDEGRPLEAGAIMQDPDLADTVRQIGEEGAECLYTGELARRIALDLQERGGLLTAADLAAYRPVLRPALVAELEDWQLACNPPPSIGGPVLTAMLRVLAGGERPITPTTLAQAMRGVLDLRLHRVDLAPDLEAAGRALLGTIAAGGRSGLPTSPSTAHVSVVDGEGNACALTASAGYGSGMSVGSTGLIGNNALGEPELNRHGLHALAPGTRMASNMAPTTAAHPDGTRMAIGSPGADRITTALTQVLVHLCVHGDDLQHAIDRARLHVRHLDDGGVRIDHEEDEQLAEALAAQELPTHLHPAQSMYFGGVAAALRTSEGVLLAAADPRRAAATAVV